MFGFIRIILTASLIAIFAFNAALAADVTPDPYELSLEDNINTPAIPSKKRENVKEAVSRLRHQLEKENFTVGRLRNGEAILITIPCSELFNSNSTEISNGGKKILAKLDLLEDYISKYKLLIAVHSDDTGEEAYADAITSQRANAINDYLDHVLKLENMTIIPYGLGRDEPLVANDSIKNRGRNRRVEIYLIPLQTIYSSK